MVVLLQTGPDKYHVIGLVGVVWKAVTVILNSRFAASIIYPKSLHGFWSGCGTGTASLEVKIIQQIMAMREKLLHTIFLDLYKAYAALERSSFIDILQAYGKGNRDLCIL